MLEILTNTGKLMIRTRTSDNTYFTYENYSCDNHLSAII